jgi:uncharacterized protein (TIGR02145 family)
MKNLLLSILTGLLLLGSSTSGFAQSTALHDSVPYQGDTLLVTPLPGAIYDGDLAYLDCDWNTLMSMIRDLEERLAGALEADTVYDIYLSGQVLGKTINMYYDCVVLRDSVVSLQIQLDEALLGPPTLLSQEVMSIAQRTASIKAKVTDDGGAAMRIWGVVYGKQDWWNDSLGFFEIDSLFPTDVDYATISDSLLADRLTTQETAMGFWSPPSDLPIPTAMDTSILSVDSIFTRSISGLERYTNYIAIPVAANDSLMMDFTTEGGEISVKGTELNAYILGLYGMGDTLMFQTLADTASGFTLDTAAVTSNSARLIASIADAGGQGPDAVQFQYDTSDFTAATFAGDSLSSDSTGGTYHTAGVTGLTRYTDYSFRAFADNAQGRGNSETSMTFKTLPELPTFDTLYYDDGQDSLISILSDNGGQTPTAQEMEYASDLAFTSPTDLSASHRNDTIRAYTALLSGEKYYVFANATNNAGVGSSDTLLLETKPEVTTFVLDWGEVDGSLFEFDSRTSNFFTGASFYRSAIPTAYGFIYGDSLLASAVDTVVTADLDSTFLHIPTDLNPGTKYWVSAYATNLGGTAYGDTLYAGATCVGFATDSSTALSHNSINFKRTGSYTDALPDSAGFIWSSQSDFSEADTVVANLPGAGSKSWMATISSDSLQGGDEIYYFSYVQNERGIIGSDTLSLFTKPKVETLPLLATTDTTATLSGKLLEFMDLAGYPDTVGFEWSTTDESFTNPSDSSFAFDLGSLPSDSIYSLQLPFEYGTSVWYRFFAKNVSGVQNGQTKGFCAGACPEQLEYMGETYPIVRIGCYCYFADNLRTEVYVSGDSIAVVPTNSAAEKELYSTYETAFLAEDSTRGDTLGRFYSYKLLTNSQYKINQAICPPGWGYVNWDTLYSSLSSIVVLDEDDQIDDSQAQGNVFTTLEKFNAYNRFLKSTSTDDPPFDGENGVGFSLYPTGFYGGNGSWTRGGNGQMVVLNGSPIPNLIGDGGYFYRLEFETESSVYDQRLGVEQAYNATPYSMPVRCRNNGIETAPTLISIPASQTTSNSARLNGKVAHPGWKTTTELATVSDRGFVFASDPDFTDMQVISVGLNASDTIFLDVTGLVEDQEYWFSPYAANQYADTVIGDILSFTANVPDVPEIQTLPIRRLRQERFGKIENAWEGVLRHKNNSELISAGWTWYRANDLSDISDSIENPLIHSEIEDLVLSLDTIFRLEELTRGEEIYSKDLKPGAEYRYFVSATNGIGTGYGDTLSVFVPMLIQPWSTSTTDSSVTIDGKVFWNDGDIDTLAIVLSENDGSDEWDYTELGDLNSDYEFMNQHKLTKAQDTVFVSINPDSTFSITVDLTQNEVDDYVNYQFFATNTHAQADTALTDTSYSQVNFFRLGECPSIDYGGYTYDTQLINDKCWFTSNLRAVTYNNGDSIAFGGTPDDITEGILDSLNANWVNGLGAYFYEDSAYASDYGLVYSRSVFGNAMYADKNVCPIGTKIPSWSEVGEIRRWANWAVKFDSISTPDYAYGYSEYYMGSHLLDEAVGGTNTSGLALNGEWFAGGSSLWKSENVFRGEGSTTPSNGVWTNSYEDNYYKVSAVTNEFEDSEIKVLYNKQNAWPIRCVVDFDALILMVTDSASNVTDSTATLNASIEFEGWRGVSETGFTWGLQADLSDGTSVSADTTGGITAIDYALSGLTPGTVHYFSAYATDASGTTYGDTLTLLTSPGITTNAADDVTDSTATLNARFSADSITAQGFVLGLLADLSDGTSVSADTTGGSTAIDYAVSGCISNTTGFTSISSSFTTNTLPCLTPGTVHYFSAYATNASGTTYGDTLALLTSPGITTIAADDVTDSTATLNATFSADSITAQGFVWGLQSDLSDGTNVSADTTGGSTAIEYALTGLTEDETYYFSAYATNASGTTYGDTLSFVAQLSPCGDLTSVSYHGYDYDIVSIGTQCWFAENLRNTNYNDGSAIPSGLDWSSTSDGAVAVYNDGATYLADYGRLYNWYAVNTGKLCPSGWHVPTDGEWTTLTDGLGGDPGDALKASASDSPAWDGTNTSGFSALAGGYLDYDGPSYDVGDYGYFWSSYQDGTDAYELVLSSGDAGVSLISDDPRYGLSVRCVLDE